MMIKKGDFSYTFDLFFTNSKVLIAFSFFSLCFILFFSYYFFPQKPQTKFPQKPEVKAALSLQAKDEKSLFSQVRKQKKRNKQY